MDEVTEAIDRSLCIGVRVIGWLSRCTVLDRNLRLTMSELQVS